MLYPTKLPHLRQDPAKRAKQPPTILPASAVWSPPPEPRLLKRAGRRAWRRIWEAGRGWLHPVEAYSIITRLCQGYDEEADLLATIEKDGYFSRDSQGQKVAHPVVKMLRTLERQLTRYERACGFTPSDRAQLGLPEPRPASRREELMARRQAR
jgi:P27 family predicted phage terminase small subunit